MNDNIFYDLLTITIEEIFLEYYNVTLLGDFNLSSIK